MSWSIARTYMAAKPTTVSWLREHGVEFWTIDPPATPSPLVVLENPASVCRRPQFLKWKKSARPITVQDILPRLPRDVGVEGTFLLKAKQQRPLYWISLQTNAAIVQYVAETFGGTWEFEWGWVYGKDERIFLRGERQGKDRREVPVFEVTASCVTERAQEPGVLQLAMPYVGVHLATGYFQPHMREFGK